MQSTEHSSAEPEGTGVPVEAVEAAGSSVAARSGRPGETTGTQSSSHSEATDQASALGALSDVLFAALAHASGNLDRDLPALLQVIAEGLGFEVATMWWWKPQEGLLRCEHVWQSPYARCTPFLDLALTSSFAPGDALPGLVFREEEPVWVADLQSYPNLRRSRAAEQVGLRSGVALPIRARDDIVGVFELFTLRRRELDAPLLSAVATAAAHLGDFIERLNVSAQRDRLLLDLATAHRRQGFLLEANRALSAARGLAETIDRLARVAVPAIADLCLIDVVSRDGVIERLTAFHADPTLRDAVEELKQFPPLYESEHPAALVIRSGTSVVSHDIPDSLLSSTTRGSRHYRATQRLHFASYISAPLLSVDGTIGAMTVVSSGSGRHFGEEERQLVEELALQVASVVERERRYDEQRHVAHILQRSMLPDIEAQDGLDVCARYIGDSADTEIGGDFYDVVRVDDSKVALVIGDVQGHDLVAVTAMAKVRSAIRAFLQMTADPEEVLRAVDTYVSGQPEDRFVTLALGLLDLSSGDLELALAGHPAPLLVGETVEPIECDPGPPAGLNLLTGGAAYPVIRRRLEASSSLLFYTDGLVEAARGGPEERLQILFKAVGRHRGEPLAAACDAIVEETLAGTPPSDDVAVLWARAATEE